MAGITLDSLTKSYGPTEVLHHISAEIEDGEFVVIVGPSGCGKSTLLRLIAGLEDITSGHIAIEINIAGGHQLKIIGGYDPEALARLIRGLSG
mgnify:CR=1 FL=1